MSRYQNKELRETVIELWNNNEGSKAIAENEKVKSLWGKGILNANAIGCYVAELRRSYKANLNYRGCSWQRERYKTREGRSSTLSVPHRQSKKLDVKTLLNAGAALKNEDPIKYLTKILIEAINNDFRRFNV